MLPILTSFNIQPFEVARYLGSIRGWDRISSSIALLEAPYTLLHLASTSLLHCVNNPWYFVSQMVLQLQHFGSLS
jgi:hypothetical protein